MGKERNHHFGLFGHHPLYIELDKDGIYRSFSGTSTGEVFASDEGHWHQDGSGIITITAQNIRADVIAGPLTVYVGGTVHIKYLPEVKNAILKYLGSTSVDRFPVGDYPEIGILQDHTMDVRLIGYWKEERPTHVTRPQLEALVKAIELYQKDSSLRYRKVKPLRYKKQNFLIPVNYGLASSVDVRVIKKRIDKGDHKEFLLPRFAGITEQDFKESITSPASVLRMQNGERESNK